MFDWFVLAPMNTFCQGAAGCGLAYEWTGGGSGRGGSALPGHCLSLFGAAGFGLAGGTTCGMWCGTTRFVQAPVPTVAFRPRFSSQGLTEAAQQLRESEESRTSALDASRRLVDEFEDQKRLAKETEAQQKQLTEQLKASGQEVRVLSQKGDWWSWRGWGCRRKGGCWD